MGNEQYSGEEDNSPTRNQMARGQGERHPQGGRQQESHRGSASALSVALLRGTNAHMSFPKLGSLFLPINYSSSTEQAAPLSFCGSNTSQSFFFTTESLTAGPTKTACSWLPNFATCVASGALTGHILTNCYAWLTLCFLKVLN